MPEAANVQCNPSFDAATAKLIDTAHVCEPLPTIDDELPFRSLGELWYAQGTQRVDQPWMTYYPCHADDETPTTYSYGAFLSLVERVAKVLANQYGVLPGGSIATLTINEPMTVAIYFAAWRIGARVVPINPSESDDRVGYIVGNSDATVLIAHATARKNFSGIEKAIGPNVRRAMSTEGEGGAGGTAAKAIAGWDDFAALVALVKPSPMAEPPPPISWDNEALVVYTSGTTGNPKGVVLTQKQMLCDAWAICRWHHITHRTVMMNVLPIHHVNGTVVTLLTPAFTGAHVVVNRRFRSGGFWRKLARHTVEIVSVVPTLLQFLIEADEPYRPEDIPAFRHFICGAGPLSVEVARDFQEKFGLRIAHGYGLSETVCYSCFLPVDLEWDEHCSWMYDHGFPSIGCPVEVNEMAIHDDRGLPVPDGVKGEIVIRGHNVMVGYFKNPEVNATTFKFGWFRSGDEGFRRRGNDGRDYYFITGRLKELIIRGGVNISPFEIDEVLTSMPGVRVGLAVGFDNRYYGEEVGAYVQVQPGQAVTDEAVMAYCRDKLPASKCPKVVLFGDDIPVTSTGKYQRGKLKPLFEKWKDVQFKG